MKFLATLSCAAAVAAALPATAAEKNWTPPAQKIYGQTLSDETMAAHPELLSVTLHGVPPGMNETYTMFAGSYPERIGNPDDPDDIDVIKKGITIVDPRWHRTQDNPKKMVVLMPMRDTQGQNVGLIVYAFKNPPVNPHTSEAEIATLKRSAELRDELQAKIPSYAALFQPTK